MTAELSARLTPNRLWFYVRCAVGVLVLLPAFVVWLQVAFLDNVVRSKGESGGWHSFVILLTTIGYLVALVIWMMRQERGPLRDGYLIAYCAYIAGLLAFASSGNFLHQIGLYGLITAVSNHLDALLYVALPVVFLVDRLILLLQGEREQSNL